MLLFNKIKLPYLLARLVFKIIFNIFSNKIDMQCNELKLTQEVVTSIPKTNKHGKYLKLHLSLEESLKSLQMVIKNTM